MFSPISRDIGRRMRPACLNCSAKNPIVMPASIIPRSDRSNKNRAVAGVFALLLGGLDVYELYLDDIDRGITMLLFCWTGIPSIIGFIRGIIYLTESNDAFSRVLSNK